MNATRAQIDEVPAGPVLPEIPAVMYAVAVISKFFSGNSSIPWTEKLSEVVASVGYNAAGGVMTLTADEGETVLHRIHAASYDCSAQECRLFLSGWLAKVNGEVPQHLGGDSDLWGQIVVSLDASQCQASVEQRSRRARHQ